MKRLVLLALGAFVLGGFAVAQADEEDHATAHVYIEVDPNMAVAPLEPTVDMGSVQTGYFTGWVPFRIDSNTQTIKVMAEASDLYKGNDPTNTEVAPIPLDMEEAIEIDCDNANPTGGTDAYLPYDYGQSECDGFPSFTTEWLELESSQNNKFSQDCMLHIVWNQDDPEKPMGEYSGCVGLWAMIVLPS
jgi:hypothetical protein